MSTQPPEESGTTEPIATALSFNDRVALIADWFNNQVFGESMALIICIAAVVIVYICIPLVGGYAKWNTGLGLFFNTASSSYELITGTAAVVAVVALHKKTNTHRKELKSLHKEHAREIQVLHDKIDRLMHHHGVQVQKEAEQ